MPDVGTARRSSIAEEYWLKGYISLSGLFSATECGAIQEECKRLFSLFSEERDAHNLRVQFRDHRRGKPVLDRIDPIRDLSPLLRDLAQDPRILAPVSEVLGERGLLFKDKVILKAPGTHGYRAHQDYTYWQELPAPPDALLSVLFAVDESSSKNGGLELFPGLHRSHYRKPETPSNIFDPNEGLIPPDVAAEASVESMIQHVGDMIVFHSLTPHQSGVNSSAETRCSIYFSYVSASYGDLYEEYYRNYHRYLRNDRAAEGDLLHVR